MDTSSERFDLYLVGIVGDPGAAAQRLAESFNIPQQQAAALLQQLPMRVKQNVPREIADQLERTLTGIGAEVTVKPIAPPPDLELDLGEAPTPDATPAPELAPAPTAAPSPIPAPVREPHREVTHSSPPAQGPPWRKAAIYAAVALTLAGLYWLVRGPTLGGLDVIRLAAGDRKPTLVLMHGYGAPGDDLVGIGEEMVAALPGLQVVLPEGEHRAGRGHAWWTDERQEAIDARNSVIELIDDLVDEGTIPGQIVVAGFSQGASLAMDVALYYRDDLAGIAMLSGRKQPDLGWRLQLDEQPPMHVLVAHGSRDRMVQFRGQKKFAAEAERLDHQVTFVQFEGGHTIPDDVRASLADFLAQRLEL